MRSRERRTRETSAWCRAPRPRFLLRRLPSRAQVVLVGRVGVRNSVRTLALGVEERPLGSGERVDRRPHRMVLRRPNPFGVVHRLEPNPHPLTVPQHALGVVVVDVVDVIGGHGRPSFLSVAASCRVLHLHQRSPNGRQGTIRAISVPFLLRYAPRRRSLRLLTHRQRAVVLRHRQARQHASNRVA